MIRSGPVRATLAVALSDVPIFRSSRVGSPARGDSTRGVTLHEVFFAVTGLVVVFDRYLSAATSMVEFGTEGVVFIIAHVADAIGKGRYSVAPKKPAPSATHHEFKEEAYDEKHQKGFEQEKGYQPQAREQQQGWCKKQHFHFFKFYVV